MITDWLPLPKKNYGNHMANLGPYLVHIWEWYGKVEWWYGADMGPYFGKIEAMERKADVLHCMGDLRECIPHIFPIALAFLFALKFVWE